MLISPAQHGLHLFQMCRTGVHLPDRYLMTCPVIVPTPHPHPLTSISLSVTPQQIRKASQHLHGDGSQSSRWPQCAAAIKEGATRGGKKVGQDRGEQQGRQCEAASALGLHTHTHICTCTPTHTYARVHLCSGALLPGSPCKNKHSPRQSQSISSVRMKRGVS